MNIHLILWIIGGLISAILYLCIFKIGKKKILVSDIIEVAIISLFLGYLLIISVALVFIIEKLIPKKWLNKEL